MRTRGDNSTRNPFFDFSDSAGLKRLLDKRDLEQSAGPPPELYPSKQNRFSNFSEEEKNIIRKVLLLCHSFIESVGECSTTCMQSREDCNSCIQEHNKSILKQAFEAGRTVVNYKMEWQETYSDNKTEAKYKTFEDWYKKNDEDVITELDDNLIHLKLGPKDLKEMRHPECVNCSKWDKEPIKFYRCVDCVDY